MASAGLGEEEAFAALGAVEGAAEVVVVSPAALARLALRGEDALDGVEGGFVDQGLVPALVGGLAGAVVALGGQAESLGVVVGVCLLAT